MDSNLIATGRHFADSDRLKVVRLLFDQLIDCDTAQLLLPACTVASSVRVCTRSWIRRSHGKTRVRFRFFDFNPRSIPTSRLSHAASVYATGGADEAARAVPCGVTLKPAPTFVVIRSAVTFQSFAGFLALAIYLIGLGVELVDKVVRRSQS